MFMVDDLLGPRKGPGRRPKLSDAELLCLAIARALLGYHSERRWLRAVTSRLGHLFPYVCAARPPTTAACAGPRRWSPRSARPWRWRVRRGVTPGGCWTPPRSPVAQPPDGAALGAGRVGRLRLWAGSASGSRRSSTPSRTSSAWRATAPTPSKGSGSGSPSGCWPWPPAYGSTGSSTPRSSARWSPTTTNATHQSTSVI
jgi:hypothetical protein